MLKTQRLTLALALALGAPQALALGLGSIDVKSGLNEPLVAEIPIVSSKAGELDGLSVALASPDAFARIGLDRPAIMAANLQFAVERNERGQPVIRVTTADKVRDPYLNFLLEVETARGRLLREYTVLLDPPVVNPIRRSPAVSTPAASAPAASAPATPVPATPPPVAPTPPAAAPPTTTPPTTAPPTTAPSAPVAAADVEPTPTPAAPRADLPADGTITVAEGQTLWSVARQVRPDRSLNTDQVMLALQEANPDAFIDGNINRLKSGAVLRIPDRDAIAAIAAPGAAQRVREQNEQWRGAPVVQPAGVERPRESASQPAAPSNSRLEIVPPSGEQASQAQSGASGDDGRELRAELDRSLEQVSALEQENRELRSRVSDLEKIDEDTRRLIELKDSQLADAQRQLAALQAAREAEAAAAGQVASPATDLATSDEATGEPIDGAPASAPTDPATLPGSAGEPVATTDDPAATVPAATVPAAIDSAAVDPAASEPSVTEPVAGEPAVAEPAVDTAAPAAAPAPEARPWWRDPKVIGGAGVLLVGLLALLGLRGRRKPEEPRRGGSVADAYAAATAGAGLTAEEQATMQEQQLLDEIAEQPDDLGRHLALVRHYYENRDPSGFEGAAEAMYAQLYDPDDSAWKEVVAMGRDILPDHPLFAVTEADEASFAANLEAAQAADHDPLDEPGPSYPTEAEPATSREVDWSATPVAEAADEQAPEPAFDSEPDAGHAEPPSFDVDATQTYSIDELERIAAQAEDEPPAGEVDLDMAPADEGYALPIDDEPLAADADEAVGDAAGSDEAAATKLELARAYLDMGDVEGARGMLEEVVGEGNPGQRSEARRLLDEIR